MFGLFKTPEWRKQSRLLYTTISAVSREPELYLSRGIPDTVEGRFESLSLHVALVLRRLKALPPPALDVSKEVVDLFFADLDAALRDLGVGDLSVGKRIKRLAQAFYGQAKSLDQALAATAAPDELEAVLARNVIGSEGEADAVSPEPLADYVRHSVRLLDRQDLSAILGAEQLFPGLEAPVFTAAQIP